MTDFETQFGEGFAGEGVDAAHINTVLGAKGGPVSASSQEAGPVRACPLGCREVGAAIGELATTMAMALSRNRYTLARCGCGQLRVELASTSMVLDPTSDPLSLAAGQEHSTAALEPTWLLAESSIGGGRTSV